MAKKKSSFYCKECGYESVGWLGKCPGCGQFNTFVEAPDEKPATSNPKADSQVQNNINEDIKQKNCTA